MITLPKLQFSNYSDQQRAFLAIWLDEYDYDSLAKSSNDNNQVEEYIPDNTITDEQRAKLKTLVKPFDNNIQAGQIRLLSSQIVPNNERPYYVAVIKELADNMMLIAPYSPFTVPATGGELKTTREHFTLSALQLWNARTIHTVLLHKSWLVDELTDEECEDAFAVFANISSDKPLDDALQTRIGLPVVNDQDPRLEYQKIEAALLEPLLQRTVQLEKWLALIEDREQVKQFTSFAEQNLQLPAAAGDEFSAASRCIVLSDDVIGKFYDLISSGEGVEVCKAQPVDFHRISPDQHFDLPLQWDLPEGSLLKGDELVFAFDAKTHSLIGSGNIVRDDDECFVNLDTVPQKNIKRVITSPADIMLLVANI